MQRSLFTPNPPTVQASRAAIIALLKARQAEMPSPRTSPPIGWSALPSGGSIVMVPSGHAMSGKTSWSDLED